MDAGMEHECHVVGHDGDEDACAEIYEACIELCSEDHHDSDAG
jgi:hypothetical protein